MRSRGIWESSATCSLPGEPAQGYHQRVHSLDTGADPHHFRNFSTQIADTVVKQIHAVKPLVFIAATAEAGQCFITQRLFFITGRMQSVLVMHIQHQVFNHLVIREVEKFFYDQGSDNDIDRSVWTGCRFRVKNAETVFINCGKYLVRKYCCPRFHQTFSFALR